MALLLNYILFLPGIPILFNFYCNMRLAISEIACLQHGLIAMHSREGFARTKRSSIIHMFILQTIHGNRRSGKFFRKLASPSSYQSFNPELCSFCHSAIINQKLSETIRTKSTHTLDSAAAWRTINFQLHKTRNVYWLLVLAEWEFQKLAGE